MDTMLPSTHSSEQRRHHLGCGEVARGLGRMQPLNQASARTMHAAGMTEEGTIRGHMFSCSIDLAWSLLDLVP